MTKIRFFLHFIRKKWAVNEASPLKPQGVGLGEEERVAEWSFPVNYHWGLTSCGLFRLFSLFSAGKSRFSGHLGQRNSALDFRGQGSWGGSTFCPEKAARCSGGLVFFINYLKQNRSSRTILETARGLGVRVRC